MPAKTATGGELDELRRAIAGVPGWLTDEEATALYQLAKQCTGRGVIVEIGSWKGKSTICLALGSRDGAGVRVFAVDPHTEGRFDEFRQNVERAGVSDLVVPVRSLSQAAADDFHEPIELLWIDGSHEYGLVKEDVEKWVPKLVEGGILAMHDTTWTPGPRKVVSEYVLRSRRFKDARFVIGSTTIARKVDGNSLADRMRSRYVIVLKASFALVSAVLKRRRGLVPARLERAGRRVLGSIQ